MLMFIGDIHGEFHFFREMKKGKYKLPEEVTVIQVGDFGISPWTTGPHMDLWPPDLPWKTYFIDGNHEFFPHLTSYTEVTEIKPNLFYVPRGTIMELDGVKMGFMGGAESIDKAWRTAGKNWFADERVSMEQVEAMLAKKESVDLLVTHAPPINVIHRNFGHLDTEHWNLPYGWKDISSQHIEYLWGNMGMPPLICGHMHKSVVDGNVRILDINEPYVWNGNITENVMKVAKE